MVDAVWIDIMGLGSTFLVTLLGILVLVAAGRLRPDIARPIGLGRHAEALILLVFLLLGVGNFSDLPVFVDERGLLLVSFTGGLIPTILSLRFLWCARWRGLAYLPGLAAAAVVAYYMSRVAPGLGIVSEFPDFFLPAIVAAVFAHMVAPGRLQAVTLAYAGGSLGGLIGADIARLGWVVREATGMGASVGGAGAMDLVSLLGLWSAAFAALPLLGRFDRNSPPSPWQEVHENASQGRLRRAVEAANLIAVEAVRTWAQRRGYADQPWPEIRRRCYAEPVLAKADRILWSTGAIDLEEARDALESLEGLERRLSKVPTARPATRGRRFGAGAIDLVVPLIVAIAAFQLVATGTMLPLEGETPDETQTRTALLKTIFILAVAFATHIVYPLISEAATRGYTFGKWVLGIRVVRMDGRPISAWDAVVRNLARLLDMSILYVIALAAPADVGHQRLGDYFAQTVVSYAKPSAIQPAVATTPRPMPAQAQPAAPATAFSPR